MEQAAAATARAHALGRWATGTASQCKVSEQPLLAAGLLALRPPLPFDARCLSLGLTVSLTVLTTALIESVEGLGPDERTDTWTTLGIEPSQPAAQQSATAKKISQRIFELLRVAYDPAIAVRRTLAHTPIFLRSRSHLVRTIVWQDGLHVSRFQSAQAAAPHYDATLPGEDSSAPPDHNWSVRRDGA